MNPGKEERFGGGQGRQAVFGRGEPAISLKITRRVFQRIQEKRTQKERDIWKS